MMDSFEISHSARTITWQLPERIDRASAPSLYKNLEHVIWEGTCLILDLSKTQFIDETGIDVLKASFMQCQRQTVWLGVRGMKPSIKALLESAGFLKAFQTKAPQFLNTKRPLRKRAN